MGLLSELAEGAVTSSVATPLEGSIGMETSSNILDSSPIPGYTRTGTISTDKQKYGADDGIKVFFEEKDARADDWVGLYPAGLAEEGFASWNVLDWTTVCGLENCDDPVNIGSVHFANPGAGLFQVYLLRNGEPPYPIVAASTEFSVDSQSTSSATPHTYSEATISAEKEKYLTTEEVAVHFANPDASLDDWIGLYRAGEEEGDFVPAHVIDWAPACGFTACHGPPTTGSASFAGLESGSYQIFLISNVANPPYPIIAASPVFIVSDTSSIEPQQDAVSAWHTNPEATISAEKEEYLTTEEVAVEFTNTDANLDDWIGLYRAGEEEGGFVPAHAIDWVPACGLNACRKPPTTGSASFSGLEIGSYQVFLVYNVANPPYPIIAASSVFIVSATSRIEPQPDAVDGGFIKTEKTEYYSVDAIVVEFVNPGARIDDWIGVYTNGKGVGGFVPGDVIDWLPACDLSVCDEPVKNGNVTFEGLEPGSYEAFLLRNMASPPYPIIFSSSVFHVSSGSSAMPQNSMISGGIIETDKTDYYSIDDIVVEFANPSARFDDWIGLYFAGQGDSGFVPWDAIDWMPVCIPGECDEPPSAGSVSFGSLEPGQYQAYLVRNNVEPTYPIIASSAVITVHDDFDELIMAADLQPGLLNDEANTPTTTFPSTVPSTPDPTNDLTSKTTNEPTHIPTRIPTLVPSALPSTLDPTNIPTKEPTNVPNTIAPTNEPTGIPTRTPTARPSSPSTPVPTNVPTKEPTTAPTIVPTAEPMAVQTLQPSGSPSHWPTNSPTRDPFEPVPTEFPLHLLATILPTRSQTRLPSALPTLQPSFVLSSDYPATLNPTWLSTELMHVNQISSVTHKASHVSTRVPSALPPLLRTPLTSVSSSRTTSSRLPSVPPTMPPLVTPESYEPSSVTINTHLIQSTMPSEPPRPTVSKEVSGQIPSTQVSFPSPLPTLMVPSSDNIGPNNSLPAESSSVTPKVGKTGAPPSSRMVIPTQMPTMLNAWEPSQALDTPISLTVLSAAAAAESQSPVPQTSRPNESSSTVSHDTISNVSTVSGNKWPSASAAIHPEKLEYYVSDVIKLEFTVPGVTQGEWIGVYPTGQIENGYLPWGAWYWVYVCGTQTCSEPASKGTVSFSNLEPGAYQAFILTGIEPPFAVVAASDTFDVLEMAADIPEVTLTPENEQETHIKPMQAVEAFISKQPHSTEPSDLDSAPAIISVDRPRYDETQSVVLSFTNPNASLRDWIGIYPVGSERKGFVPWNFLTWAYACGNVSFCDSNIARSGTLDMGPFEAGIYEAFLLSDQEEPPYPVIAASQPFVVIGQLNSPSPMPTNFALPLNDSRTAQPKVRPTYLPNSLPTTHPPSVSQSISPREKPQPITSAVDKSIAIAVNGTSTPPQTFIRFCPENFLHGGGNGVSDNFEAEIFFSYAVETKSSSPDIVKVMEAYILNIAAEHVLDCVSERKEAFGIFDWSSNHPTEVLAVHYHPEEPWSSMQHCEVSAPGATACLSIRSSVVIVASDASSARLGRLDALFGIKNALNDGTLAEPTISDLVSTTFLGPDAVDLYSSTENGYALASELMSEGETLTAALIVTLGGASVILLAALARLGITCAMCGKRGRLTRQRKKCLDDDTAVLSQLNYFNQFSSETHAHADGEEEEEEEEGNGVLTHSCIPRQPRLCRHRRLQNPNSRAFSCDICRFVAERREVQQRCGDAQASNVPTCPPPNTAISGINHVQGTCELDYPNRKAIAETSPHEEATNYDNHQATEGTYELDHSKRNSITEGGASQDREGENITPLLDSVSVMKSLEIQKIAGSEEMRRKARALLQPHALPRANGSNTKGTPLSSFPPRHPNRKKMRTAGRPWESDTSRGEEESHGWDVDVESAFGTNSRYG